MKPEHIAEPTLVTLRKYGLVLEEWYVLGDRQDWKCPCGRVPGKGRSGQGRYNIDHEHVKGWKTMAPADRARHVRGLVCWTCNFFQLAKGATAERLRLLADYLDEYERRRDGTSA